MGGGDVPTSMTSRRRFLGKAGAGLGAGTVLPGLAGCVSTFGGSETETGGETAGGTTVDSGGMSLSSSAFEAGRPVPTRYTCDGANESPPLSVAGVPDGTVSLSLVVDDPDAPGDPYVHWLVWNLPPDVGDVPAGVPASERVDSLDGAVQGTNSSGDVGYTGPCPPKSDGAHTYRFTLYALEQDLDLDPGAKRPALAEAMADAVVARTRLTGTYDR